MLASTMSYLPSTPINVNIKATRILPAVLYGWEESNAVWERNTVTRGTLETTRDEGGRVDISTMWGLIIRTLYKNYCDGQGKGHEMTAH
jgi:hypothetical protein